MALWGAPAPVLANIAWGSVAFTAAVRFIDPLDGPLGEEPGWRGWARTGVAAPPHPRSAPPSSSVPSSRSGTCRWCRPGNSLRSASIATFGITLVYVWLFNHTGGSVLLTMVFHVAQGTVSLAALGFTGADAARMDWLTGALWCLIAAVLVVADRNAWRVAPPSAIAVHGAAAGRALRATSMNWHGRLDPGRQGVARIVRAALLATCLT